MRPTALRIRDEIPADHAAIETVTEAAFRNAPHAGRTEHFIVNALRAANRLSISLVAESEGEIVGHVAVSPVSIADGTPDWFGLGPISVAPACQGRGIGSSLVTEALRRLRESGAAGCVLVGDPAYYRRFVFRAEPNLVYPGLPPQYFQAIAFTPTLPRGTVSYHEAFDTPGVAQMFADTNDNPSMPSATVIPVLHYADVASSVAWLCGAFGFTERLRIGGHRVQLSVGSGAIVVAGQPASTPRPSGQSVMVRVRNLDEHFERASRAGAQILAAPTSFPYGERQYTARDPGGHVWTFSESIASVPPSAWGGELVQP